jgi:hypothetical protein
MRGSSPSRRIVLVLSGLAVAGLLGCSQDSRSPTEPSPTPAFAAAPSVAPQPGDPGERRAARRAAALGEDAGAAEEAPAGAEAAEVAAVAEAAQGGTGGNGGNGKGPGDKGPGNRPNGGALRLELQPDVWNTNWEHSGGTVSAKITGNDLAAIDLGSIVLVGTDPAAAPLPALRAELHGNHVRAFFAKDDALATLDTPARGELHRVEVEFDQDGAPQSLVDTVRIVGPGGDDDDGDDEEEVDLRLDIQPDAWNLNWRKSRGTVTALIRGDGLSTIDLTSIVLVGTDPAAAPLPALRAKLSGNHVRAWFSQSAALATLDTPKRGEAHEVTIRLTADGAEVELVDEIRIVGPNH